MITRVEASDRGGNLASMPRWLYEDVYCARGQAENLMRLSRPMRMRSGPLPCCFLKT